MRLPFVLSDSQSFELAKLVVQSSWFPNEATVKAFKSEIFPTIRAGRGFERFELVMQDGEAIGMYDDNATPRWAISWAHGFLGAGRNAASWSFAHVWSLSTDMGSYTRLANLALVPEALASLTDKSGPLTPFLRYHAFSKYGWMPAACEAPPPKPPRYDELSSYWKYLDQINDPRAVVADQISKYDNERLRILRPIMKERGYL